MRFFASLHRLWKWCHPFTWVVMLVVGVGLVIIVVPGEETYSWANPATPWEIHCQDAVELSVANHPDGLADIRVLEHGWPMPYLARTRYFGETQLSTVGKYQAAAHQSKMRETSWMQPRSWPLEGEVWRINWLGLLVDLLVFGGGMVLVAVGTERWLRSRGGLFRFKMIDLLAAVAICAIALGWYESQTRQRRLDLALVEQFDLQVPLSPYDVDALYHWSYQGPAWLSKLAGNVRHLPTFLRLTRVEMWIDPAAKADVVGLSRLKDVELVTISGALPRDALVELKQLQHLRSLSLHCFDYETYVGVDVSNDLVLADDLEELGDLGVSELTLGGNTIGIYEVEKVLAAMPELRLLKLDCERLTPTDIEDWLTRYPRVTIRNEYQSPRDNPFDF